MHFHRFLYDALNRNLGPEAVCAPFQFALTGSKQTAKPFVLRLHDATRLHFDLRFQIFDTLFSLVLLEKLSLNPGRATRLKLMPDHNPNYLLSERVIPYDMPGAGATMPVDTGMFIPIGADGDSYDMEALRQIMDGTFRFFLDGTHLRGAWMLKRKRGDRWILAKLEDAYASQTTEPDLTRSILTGREIHELYGSPERKAVKASAWVMPSLFEFEPSALLTARAG